MAEIDCDSLPGRLREICNGTAYKGNGKPFSLQDRKEVISRRLGISPDEIVLPASQSAIRQQQNYYSGIGSRLHKIIERETGQSIPCSKCKQEIDQLNVKPASQVRKEKQALASRIVKRARGTAPKWWQRWGSRLAAGLAKRRVLRWIEEACGDEVQEEKEEEKEDPPQPFCPINRIVTAIRTSPRAEPTLDNTLLSLAQAGFENPILFGEPDAPAEVDVRWSERKGSFKGFIDHAYWLLANRDDYWFLLCEDDVEFPKGLADHIKQYRLSNEIVTLFKPHGLNLSGEGLVPVSAVNGSLAILIHRDTLRRIIESKTAVNWPRSDCVDRFLGRAAKEIRVRILSPTKSWVQHKGRTSVCQPRRWKNNSLTHRMRYASDFDPEIFEPKLQIRVIDNPPEFTLITPTGDRSEAFALCERWMARQTYKEPMQWIVIDDGRVPTNVTMGQEYIRRPFARGHTLTANLRAAIPQIQGDKVLIIEDDEWYDPNYIENMAKWLDIDSLVGAGHARYYWPRLARYREFPEFSHASLCRTGFKRELLPFFSKCCTTSHPSVDLRLWSGVAGRRREKHLVLGMKQMPGRRSGGGQPDFGKIDSDLSVLKSWIGSDVDLYRPILPKAVDPSRALHEKIVVFTVVIGGYDTIHAPTTINPHVRYVAITDGSAPSPWEVIKPPVSDRGRFHESRYWKIEGHKLFPEADWTIYLDGQLQLCIDPISLIAECEAWGTGDLFVFRQHERDCIYDEASAVVKVRKDNRKTIEKQINRYLEEGFPEHAGLYMGGMLIRRNTEKIRKFNQMWWGEVEQGSHRDQISLPVALARSEIPYTVLPARWWQHFFLRYRHRKWRRHLV